MIGILYDHISGCSVKYNLPLGVVQLSLTCELGNDIARLSLIGERKRKRERRGHGNMSFGIRRGQPLVHMGLIHQAFISVHRYNNKQL